MTTDRIFANSLGLILDIKSWSGSKNLKPEDFAGVELPPEELVSLGSKRLHNREAFKPIQAVRTKAVTYLEGVALSLYSGKIWIAPEARKAEIEDALGDLAREFQTERDRFLADFHREQNAWLEKNRRWASILRPYLETPASIERKFGFTWRCFRMSSAENDLEFAEVLTTDLTGTMLREISILAGETYNSLRDRERATFKNLNRLDRLAEKLRGLSFVNHGVSVIEAELQTFLDQRDSGGALTGTALFKLTRLLVQLKSPDVLKDILDAAEQGRDYTFTYEQPQPRADTIAPAQPETPAPQPVIVPPAISQPSTQPRLPDAWF
ncbi:MAG: DUF3150 domain-containing protein [Desulfovibrionales bacterium]|nr:MAG: DUF3150 domain-containing protein [Desulfovibrionales bacterium]